MRVSFILPLFNQLALTRACLDSLHATLPAELACEIILIDDASTDGTREFLSTLAPPHVVLRNDRNLGYAASNNRAARLAQGKFLVLLNNDLVLSPGWLEPLLAAAQRPSVGVIGNLQLDARTGALDHAGLIFHQGGYPIHHRAPLASVQAAGSVIEMPAVTAACCLVDREWFCRSGGFDEGYRNGFEDVDLCLRAREDGLHNVVVTTSVVHHHISSSAGRGAYENRNAARFLARWGPRTAALEKSWARQLARDRAATEARRYFAFLPRRLGLGARALRRAHLAALAAQRRALHAATRPIRIGVDLLRLLPGGANGGIKPLVYSFLTEIARQRGASFHFAVFAQPALREELSRFLRPGDHVIEPAPTSDSANNPSDPATYAVHRRDHETWQADGTLPVAADTADRAGFDVLYAPFGLSTLSHAALPCVATIVDLLHRDLPAALPPEEVNYRESWIHQVTASATYLQCLARHGISRLGEHYGVHPTRCFHTYAAAQNRLPAPPPDAALPAGMPPSGPFFFYPANFWPHKNHETLLVAYRSYAVAAGARVWPLVLTGQPDARMQLLQELTAGLGLADRVHFLGHVADAEFSALWSRAGALVFPSLHEGFGIPLLEAMRFGVPILASDATSLPEVAGPAALLFNPRDPPALAEALRQTARREDLRADLVSRGHRRLAAFSLELEAGRLAHFLASAARRQIP